MASQYQEAVGRRLRETRTSQGLSLSGVEEKSGGRWKAVVVGSYERGERSVTVEKLAGLAEFYGVPVVSLLPEEDLAGGKRVSRLAEALTEAGAGGDYTWALAGRLDKAGVSVAKRRAS